MIVKITDFHIGNPEKVYTISASRDIESGKPGCCCYITYSNDSFYKMVFDSEEEAVSALELISNHINKFLDKNEKLVMVSRVCSVRASDIISATILSSDGEFLVHTATDSLNVCSEKRFGALEDAMAFIQSFGIMQ